MVEKYHQLLSLGYKKKTSDLEKINFHFEEMKIILIKMILILPRLERHKDTCLR